jgi:hypothetical protein
VNKRRVLEADLGRDKTRTPYSDEIPGEGGFQPSPLENVCNTLNSGLAAYSRKEREYT